MAIVLAVFLALKRLYTPQGFFYYIGIFYFLASKKCPVGLEKTYAQPLLKILTGK
ncbi:hypothetical protein J2Z42_002040 [Clostridium algifaecis]|uniref:Uncharacterized protein n=1 Tax=Clostridium algifaecis TaxID=1472040 RepID=A0ABS4KTI1_9CLOT|nr:hypothetical protein [Clostridium algifaecis]